MRVSRVLGIALIGVGVFVVGCGRLPLVASTTVSPTPEPTPPPFGTGRDGDVTVDTPGPLNTCHVLLNSASATVELDAVDDVEPGRLLLLWQVQDTFAQSGAQVALTQPGNAGVWTIARVAAVNGLFVTLEASVKYEFGTDTLRAAQACTVLEYSALTIDSEVRTADWDGSTGGVTAFYAATADVSSDIDASFAGFRGGTLNASVSVGSVTALNPPEGDGSGKGEGLEFGIWDLMWGRGNYANGGGGGNGWNAGGGGGGNGGFGGFGGKQRIALGDNPATRGFGGAPIDAPIAERLTMGGGGGAGQQDQGVGSAGARGGGLILMFVGSLTGDAVIHADGEDADDAGDNDGAGGGGAGGTIYIRAGSSTFTGQIRALGGTGGDVDQINTATLRGAGGGGGGGRVFLEGFTYTSDVTGGANGLCLDSSAGGPLAHGSTSGADGVTPGL